MIKITRIDPLGGIPDPNQHGTVLSVDNCRSWADAVDTLARFGVTGLTEKQLSDFHTQSPDEDITFQHREFLSGGVAAYSCNVNYVLTCDESGSK